jgi:RNA polymerase sigma factor (sigma-70 family)
MMVSGVHFVGEIADCALDEMAVFFSLDGVLEQVSEDALEEVIALKSEPLAFAEATDLNEMLRRSMARLTPREQEAIVLRYGLNGDLVEYSFREIGERMGVSTVRVRQLEKHALKKMLCSTVLSDLRKEIYGFERARRRALYQSVV